MILIPAIDLHGGKCVRLQQGLLGTASTYSEDPGAMSAHWVSQGARRIHVVDLDGAFAGESMNSEGVRRIVQEANRGSVPVQLGGGIRSKEAIEQWLAFGVSQIVVGTQAIEDPDFLSEVASLFPQKIILGLDARRGFVSTNGWEDTTDVTVEELLLNCADLPLFAIVYTDIERDGMLGGTNIESTTSVLQQTAIPVIASGGVKGIVDLEQLQRISSKGRKLYGAISGAALYEKRLDFQRGQRVLDTILS